MAGLDDLAQLTQSNADMVAESVMAAEDMRDQAQRLRAMVADIELELEGAAVEPVTGEPAASSSAPTPPPQAPQAIAAAGIDFF